MDIQQLEYVSTTEILNEIGKYYGNSLLERMVDFCETEDVDPQFLGDILSEDKSLKDLLHNDCAISGSIIDIDIQHRNETMEDLEIW